MYKGGSTDGEHSSLAKWLNEDVRYLWCRVYNDAWKLVLNATSSAVPASVKQQR